MKPVGRQVFIFDQLNPAYVKYYTRKEVVELMKRRFEDVKICHRRHYSWVVRGSKPKN